MSSESEYESVEGALSGQPFFSRPVGKITIIWFVFSVIGVVIGLFAPVHLLPPLMSHEGHDVLLTVILFTVLAAPVAAVVYGIAFYSLFAWRYKSDDPDTPPPDGPPIRGNNVVTSIWLVTSLVLVIVLLVWGLAAYNAEETSHPNALQIDVIGQQWLWSFKYPGTGVEARVLEVPDNRPIQFNVTSEDVTHGFWVPNFGVQVDANPDETTVVRATPDKMGVFIVRCSQLCGLYHSFMYTHGKVVTTAQFSSWLHDHGASTTAAKAVSGVDP